MKKDLIKLAFLSLAAYNAIPILNWLWPITAQYTFLTDLWIVNPIWAFAASLFFCKRQGALFWPPFLTAGLFLPTMFLFYNSSAAIFLAAYWVFAAVGALIGFLWFRRKSRSLRWVSYL